MRAVNLIPLEQRGGSGPAAGRSEGAAYAVLILLAGLVVLALLYGKASHQISSARAQIATLAVQTQQAQTKASRLTAYTTFLELREKRAQAVSALAQARFDWAYAFRELGRVLPADVAITSLTGSVGSTAAGGAPTSTGSSAPSSAAVTSATPPGSVPTFTLVGCTTSQVEVADTLVRLRLINGVTGVTLTSSTKSAAGSGSSACAAGDPTFTAVITFAPLPVASATLTALPATATGAAR